MTVVGLGHPVFELGGLAFVSSCELSLADLHSGRLEAQSLKLKHLFFSCKYCLHCPQFFALSQM